MPMHEHKWATESNFWGTTKDTAKAKPWPDSLIHKTNNTEIDLDRHNSRWIDQIISATTHTMVIKESEL
jgi:hypothetical protein